MPEKIDSESDTNSGIKRLISSKMKVEGLGVDLFVLMKVDLIPNEDLLPIVAQLK